MASEDIRLRALGAVDRLRERIGWPLALLATLILCGAALLARMLAQPYLPPGYPFVTFFPAVIISAFLFGARLGALAGIVCGLMAWYVFIPPVFSFVLDPASGFAMMFYALIVGTDIMLIHWMHSANHRLSRERELSRALAETRELLFHELQHRVSNNLQMVAGLIAVQKRGISDPGARSSLDEASRRIALIGAISRQLYDTGGGSRRIDEFLPTLCRDVVDASGITGIRCDIQVDEQLQISADAAIPLALIVAEAMANAIEHGFAGKTEGTIAVALRSGADSVHVEVRDDGHGLPEGFDIEASGSLGLRIARTLAEGLKGRFDLVSEGGTVARLTLPASAMVVARA